MDVHPAVDLPEALKRAMGDAQFLKMLLDELCNVIPDFIARLKEAHRKGDMAAMGSEAHQLKGAAANLSAKDIAAAALKLEETGKSGNPENFEQTMTELEIAAESFKQYVKQIDWTAVNDG